MRRSAKQSQLCKAMKVGVRYFRKKRLGLCNPRDPVLCDWSGRQSAEAVPFAGGGRSNPVREFPAPSIGRKVLLHGVAVKSPGWGGVSFDTSNIYTRQQEIKSVNKRVV